MVIPKQLLLAGILIFISTAGYSQGWKTTMDSAKILKDQKKTAEAIVYYTKAKEQLPGDSVLTDTYVQISKSLAELYYLAKQPDRSLVICYELLKTIEKIHTERNADYAWTCNLLGAIYNNAGNLDSAKILHLLAKDTREKLFGKKDRSYAQSCNNLGALYHDLGQFDLAEPLFLEARAIRENIEPVKKSAVYAITCVALANLYRDMGQYDKAEPLYKEAKEIRSTAGKNNADYANSCNILADLYYYMHQYKNAEDLYLEAKNIRAKLDSGSYEYGESCNNLANLYRDMEQYGKAGSLALEAKTVFEKSLPEGNNTRTINLNNLGEFYYATGRYKDAESYFLQARQLWEKKLGRTHPYFISNTEDLAAVYWNMNEVQKADQLFSEVSLLKYEQLDKIFGFTNETEKQSYLRNINGSGDVYQSFYYKKFPHNKAGQSFTISLLNRNLILSSTQQLRQVIYNSSDSTLGKIYQQWAGLKEQLANLYSRGTTTDISIVKDLEEKSGKLEKELSRESVVFTKVQKKITWQDIRQSLQRDEAAIEYVEFKLSDGKLFTDSVMYVALVLTKDKDPVLVPLFEKKQLDSLLSNTGNKTTNDGVAKLYSSRGIIVKGNNNMGVNRSVYSLVWKPLEKELSGIKTVYFAPSGLLHRIAFAALPLNKTEVLSDKYKLVQLATTASVTDQKPVFITSSDNLQLYGGINYDADPVALKRSVQLYAGNTQKHNSRSLPADLIRSSSFSYLPGTEAEIKIIREEAKNTMAHISLLSGINATEESFKALNGKASPAVIHVATHGFFFPDPKTTFKKNDESSLEINGQVFRQSDNPLFRSGLLFAGANNAWQGKTVEGIDDGILTAYEVSDMYLPGTKLAVLSACETALGDIQGSEGVYGLQRAFKMAGVQNLVMSLWKVPDAETAAFMQLFYKNMFAGESITDAFYHAQTTMKNKYRNDPYKWAAWILIK